MWLTRKLVIGVHSSDIDMQRRRIHHIQRLQHQRSPEMVSDLNLTDRHDLHFDQGPPIPEHSCVHHLQEPYNHTDRIRRGVMVWG